MVTRVGAFVVPRRGWRENRNDDFKRPFTFSTNTDHHQYWVRNGSLGFTVQEDGKEVDVKHRDCKGHCNRCNTFPFHNFLLCPNERFKDKLYRVMERLRVPCDFDFRLCRENFANKFDINHTFVKDNPMLSLYHINNMQSSSRNPDRFQNHEHKQRDSTRSGWIHKSGGFRSDNAMRKEMTVHSRCKPMSRQASRNRYARNTSESTHSNTVESNTVAEYYVNHEKKLSLVSQNVEAIKTLVLMRERNQELYLNEVRSLLSSNTKPENRPPHTPKHESLPEPMNVHESLPEPMNVHEFLPEPVNDTVHLHVPEPLVLHDLLPRFEPVLDPLHEVLVDEDVISLGGSLEDRMLEE